jgi:hypothetical protein
MQQQSWSHLVGNKTFITHLGDMPKKIFSKTHQQSVQMKKYAVWTPTEDGRHAVTEVGDDVNYLRKKYKLTSHEIFNLNQSNNEKSES